MPEKDVLYFDGGCKLCHREISHLALMQDGNLQLVDIHSLESKPDLPTTSTLLKSLHLRRGEQWLIGLSANIAAWQHTRIGWLWAWLNWPIIFPIANFFYQHWARRRYAKLYRDKPE